MARENQLVALAQADPSLLEHLFHFAEDYSLLFWRQPLHLRGPAFPIDELEHELAFCDAPKRQSAQLIVYTAERPNHRLRISVDPIGADKNLEIAEQVADNEQNQNHAGNGDDHFPADGVVTKFGNETARRCANGCGGG